jgi:hypothetical protein
MYDDISILSFTYIAHHVAGVQAESQLSPLSHRDLRQGLIAQGRPQDTQGNGSNLLIIPLRI